MGGRVREALLLTLCIVSSQRSFMFCLLRSLFFRGQHTSHNRTVQFVSNVDHLPSVILLTDGEGWQVTFLAEILMTRLHREVALKIALPISGLLAMFRPVPGEDSNRSTLPGQAILGLV